MLSTMGFVKKVGVGVVSFVLLASCVGAFGDDQTSKESSEPPTEPSSNSSTTDDPSEDASEDAADELEEPEELSQSDQWRVNYEASEQNIRKALSRQLPAYMFPMDNGTQAIATCNQLVKESPLKKRVSSAGTRWSGDANQSVVIIAVVAESVCPEVAQVHTTQVVAKRKADARVAAEKAAAAERARVAAAKKAERERAAALAAQQQAAQVYYENCTAVENAGAAPIYSGDPGYSTDLDRDGDGVACET